MKRPVPLPAEAHLVGQEIRAGKAPSPPLPTPCGVVWNAIRSQGSDGIFQISIYRLNISNIPRMGFAREARGEAKRLETGLPEAFREFLEAFFLEKIKSYLNIGLIRGT